MGAKQLTNESLREKALRLSKQIADQNSVISFEHEGIPHRIKKTRIEKICEKGELCRLPGGFAVY